MYKMEELEVGKSYACKFKTTVMLDVFDRPVGLSDVPVKGPGEYQGLGVIKVRDVNSRLVELQDVESSRLFVVKFEDCWDIDEVEWREPLVEE